MFERYTEKARRVIFFARWEASHLGSPYIETEHILLGLLREDKGLFHRLLPSVNYESIHEEVDKHTVIREKISTAVDLPLSNESKRVLHHAADEADRLNHRHIGTEHLLLGLLYETKDPGGRLLIERGAKLAEFRTRIASWGEESSTPQGQLPQENYYVPARGFSPTAIENTVEIHGSAWNADYVQDAVKKCREYSWHWHKQEWKPRDIVIHRADARMSFDLSLAEEPTNFHLQKGGWKKDHCVICRWELMESSETEHSTGYTNGRDWLCCECYEKFLVRPDFFSSSHPEST